MTRETSIAVYRELEASGALSRLRLVVAKDIAENGPTTQAETWSRLSAGKSQRYKDSYSPRFVDLQAMGVIETVGERPCAVSKKTCLAWDLTGKMPIRPETRQTRVELEREACIKIAMNVWDESNIFGKAAAQAIADRIRARGRRQ